MSNKGQSLWLLHFSLINPISTDIAQRNLAAIFCMCALGKQVHGSFQTTVISTQPLWWGHWFHAFCAFFWKAQTVWQDTALATISIYLCTFHCFQSFHRTIQTSLHDYAQSVLSLSAGLQLHFWCSNWSKHKGKSSCRFLFVVESTQGSHIFDIEGAFPYFPVIPVGFLAPLFTVGKKRESQAGRKHRPSKHSVRYTTYDMA